MNEHIQLEAQLIERIRLELPTITNNKVRLLINAILADEMRHHQLLTDVLQILVRGETITEED